MHIMNQKGTFQRPSPPTTFLRYTFWRTGNQR